LNGSFRVTRNRIDGRECRGAMKRAIIDPNTIMQIVSNCIARHDGRYQIITTIPEPDSIQLVIGNRVVTDLIEFFKFHVPG
jgi:hypothetical protein